MIKREENILNNSIDAVSKNVNERKINVRITVETISDELLSDVEASGECEMIHMEVADNGKGIAEKNMDKIFEPMYTYGKKGGTGLGLAIVKKIIDKHNGKIKAVSVLGTGTAIHIYLPILFY